MEKFLIKFSTDEKAAIFHQSPYHIQKHSVKTHRIMSKVLNRIWSYYIEYSSATKIPRFINLMSIL